MKKALHVLLLISLLLSGLAVTVTSSAGFLGVDVQTLLQSDDSDDGC